MSMNVYLLTITFPYEGDRCLGVFSTEEKANKAMAECKSADNSDGYNEFEVEAYEIDGEV